MVVSVLDIYCMCDGIDVWLCWCFVLLYCVRVSVIEFTGDFSAKRTIELLRTAHFYFAVHGITNNNNTTTKQQHK